MRTLLVTSSLVLALFSAATSAQDADAIDAPRITQQAFKKLVAAHNVIIVDTRRAETFAEGHIRGALLLPLEGSLTWPDESESVVAVLIKTRKPVVTYCACSDEATAARAALMLQARGVKNVKALRGGWNEWVKAGNPVVTSTKSTKSGPK
jgi:3-mercaptopyruvate sulfurtransferase SseA